MKKILTFVVLLSPYITFAQSQYPNPIQATSIGELIGFVAAWVRNIVLFLAAIAIIVVGFKFVSASMAGKPEEVSKARQTLLWVLIGTAIVVGASVIAGAIADLFSGQKL